MRLLVDADSMPVRLREIIVRHAGRRGLLAVFYANRPIPIPESDAAAQRVVSDADDAMVMEARSDDLAITHDVPLAARLTEKGLTVLDDRGGRFTAETIGERLSARDFAAKLREADLLPNRRREFGRREIQEFANALDRELAALLGPAVSPRSGKPARRGSSKKVANDE